MIAAELADVRRYLAETPPHHGDGARASLEQRVNRLERELAATRAAATTSASVRPPPPSGGAP